VGFPVQVQTTTLDCIWQNVPFVDTGLLNALSGRVNCGPFMGYPMDSVMFVYQDYIERAPYYRNPAFSVVYDIRFSLIIKTIRVRDKPISTTSGSQRIDCDIFPEDFINAPDEGCNCAMNEDVFKIQDSIEGNEQRSVTRCLELGIWNRTWFNELVDMCHRDCEECTEFPCEPPPPDEGCWDGCCTNWHLVKPEQCQGENNFCKEQEDYASPFPRAEFRRNMLCAIGHVRYSDSSATQACQPIAFP